MLQTIGKYAAIAALGVTAFTAANAQTVTGSITTAEIPAGLAVNFATNRIYVAVPSYGGTTDSIAVVNGLTNKIIKTISIPPVAYLVATDVVRNLVYVAGTYVDTNGLSHNELVEINGATNTVIKTIDISDTQDGNNIQGLAVNPITGIAYVSNASDNVIDIVDNTDPRQLDKLVLPAGEVPSGLAINPYNHNLYVALAGGGLENWDWKTKTLIRTTAVGSANTGVASDWLSGNVIVVNNVYGFSTVGVTDWRANLLATTAVGNTPYWVDVDFGTHNAFVTNLVDQTVSVVNDITYAETATLPVSGSFLAVNPVTQKVYVSGLNTNSVTVISEQ